jgi:YHS domain-containing protein
LHRRIPARARDFGASAFQGAIKMATDPVCQMTVDEKTAAGKSQYNGKTYYFCSASCKAKFDQNPRQYAK